MEHLLHLGLMFSGDVNTCSVDNSIVKIDLRDSGVTAAAGLAAPA